MLPFLSSGLNMQVKVPGLDEVPRLKTGGPSLSAVGADYFTTVGTPILRGRAFGPEDRAGSEAVAIVSDTMARTVWPGADPIGKCLFVGKDAAACARIVGIAADTRRSQLREPPVMGAIFAVVTDWFDELRRRAPAKK